MKQEGVLRGEFLEFISDQKKKYTERVLREEGEFPSGNAFWVVELLSKLSAK